MTDKHCNHNIPEDGEHSVFSVEVDPGVKLLLKAVVDQDLGEKENKDDLDPQTHFVNIRI